ncbi:MAG: hypothetical protein IJX77_08500 [Ruminococcus sp.]|nr:hypothetical protein [Ruminococcus sp.]
MKGTLKRRIASAVMSAAVLGLNILGAVQAPEIVYASTEEVHSYTNGFCTVEGCTDIYEPAVDSDGDGYYEIGNAGQLYWFADLENSYSLNSDNAAFPADCAVLTADIVVNDQVLNDDGTLISDTTGLREWTPIGRYNYATDIYYNGKFDGQGHTISGLYYSNSNLAYVGLFGQLKDNASVKNVGVLDSYFKGRNYVGGICGYNIGSTVTNCYSSSTVVGGTSGGVCGRNSGGTMKSCYSIGKSNHVCGENLKVMTNCYYLAESDDGECAKTAEQFANGEVTYLLNGDQSTIAWGQDIKTDENDTEYDPYPVLNGDQVYQMTEVDCPGDETEAIVYSNSNVYTAKTHTCEDGVCIYCGISETEFENIEISLIDELDTQMRLTPMKLTGVDADGNAIGFDENSINIDSGGGIISYDETALCWKVGYTAAEINNLPDGTYTISQMEVHLGYQLAADVTFVIENGDLTEVTGAYQNYGNTIVMLTEHLASNCVIFSVKNIYGNMVAGAEFSLKGITEYGKPAQFVTGQTTGTGLNEEVTWTSDALMAKSVKNLPDGTYTLHQISAPDGYAAADDVIFVMENNFIVEVDGEPVEIAEEADPLYQGISVKNMPAVTTTTTTTTTETTTTAASSEDYVKWDGFSVSLDGNIKLNLYASVDYEALNDTVITLTLGDNEPIEFTAYDCYNADTELCLFTIEVPAKDMATEIRIDAVVGGGLWTDSRTVTVKEYAEEIIGDLDAYGEEAAALAKAMLNYGAYAQEYFGYNTDNLANSGLSDEDKALGTVAVEESLKLVETGTLPDGVSYYGSSLLLKNKTIIRHYFVIEDGAEIPAVSDGWSALTEKDGYYYTEITGITAADLDVAQTLTIGDYTLSYSPLSYAYAVLSGEYKAALQNVVKALYLYNQAANAYALVS